MPLNPLPELLRWGKLLDPSSPTALVLIVGLGVGLVIGVPSSPTALVLMVGLGVGLVIGVLSSPTENVVGREPPPDSSPYV